MDEDSSIEDLSREELLELLVFQDKVLTKSKKLVKENTKFCKKARRRVLELNKEIKKLRRQLSLHVLKSNSLPGNNWKRFFEVLPVNVQKSG